MNKIITVKLKAVWRRGEATNFQDRIGHLVSEGQWKEKASTLLQEHLFSGHENPLTWAN